MTLNHDCIVVSYDADKDLQCYQGQSIDEACLLDMAQDTGDCERFIGRTKDTLRTRKKGTKYEYRIMKAFKFTSDRRCSSVVIKTNEGKMYAYVKGSDTSIK